MLVVICSDIIHLKISIFAPIVNHNKAINGVRRDDAPRFFVKNARNAPILALNGLGG